MATQVTSTICPFCGVGCGMNLRVEDGKLISVEPQLDHPISRGQLCTKGWNSAYGIDPKNRITHPLIRTPQGFRQVPWSKALETIADGLKQILVESGPQATGIISSARATNEDNYAAQKLARAVLKTNNVDHCARICHSPTVAGLNQTLGSGAMTNSAADLFETDLILIFGADPTENHTILGGHIIRAHLDGTKLIVADPRCTRLAKLADTHLQLKPGSNIALLNAMIKIILDNGWQDKKFLDQRCEGLAQLTTSVTDALEGIEKTTGIPLPKIESAAKAYSHSKQAMILYGMGITQYVSGTNNVIALSNLALICGHIGRKGTGVNPLRGQNNVQGACDMGCLPNVYPGYQKVDNPEVRAKFSQHWKTEVPERPGLTSMGMTKATLAGEFRGLILFGEDPVVTDPDQNLVKQALSKLDLLVVAELTMTDTARLADVVLPAASFAEKSGTFTNCERRVQHVQQALPPLGEARTDWLWLAAIAQKLGSNQLNWNDSESVFREMTELTPSYSAMNYTKMDQQQGLQWPCCPETPNGTPILHKDSFPIGKARLIPVHPIAIDEDVDNEYPLLLTTNRLHFHYGCGSMTRKSPLLERETPAGLLFINPADANALGVIHRSAVSIRSRRGYVETRAMLTDDLPSGLVCMPYHFREAPSNQLTNTAQDPLTKMPELKACAVSVQPLEPGIAPRPIDEIITLKTEGVK